MASILLKHVALGIAGIEAAALEQTLHPRGDPRQHDADLFICRRGQGPEIERALLAFSEEDAIEEQRVEMDVQINLDSSENNTMGFTMSPTLLVPPPRRTPGQ